MQVRITLTLDVGDDPYADAITYFIYQYGNDTEHTAEQPTSDDQAEAVEHVLHDILNAEFNDMPTAKHPTWKQPWRITDSWVLANP